MFTASKQTEQSGTGGGAGTALGLLITDAEVADADAFSMFSLSVDLRLFGVICFVARGEGEAIISLDADSEVEAEGGDLRSSRGRSRREDRLTRRAVLIFWKDLYFTNLSLASGVGRGTRRQCR